MSLVDVSQQLASQVLLLWGASGPTVGALFNWLLGVVFVLTSPLAAAVLLVFYHRAPLFLLSLTELLRLCNGLIVWALTLAGNLLFPVALFFFTYTVPRNSGVCGHGAVGAICDWQPVRRVQRVAAAVPVRLRTRHQTVRIHCGPSPSSWLRPGPGCHLCVLVLCPPCPPPN
jgi:hypothetical protein